MVVPLANARSTTIKGGILCLYARKKRIILWFFLRIAIIGAIFDHCDKNVNHFVFTVVVYNGYVLAFCHQALGVFSDVRTVSYSTQDCLREERFQIMVGKVRDMWLAVDWCSGLIGKRSNPPVGANAPRVIVKTLEIVGVYNQCDGVDQCDALQWGEDVIHFVDLGVATNNWLHLSLDLFDFLVNYIDNPFIRVKHLFQQRIVFV